MNHSISFICSSFDSVEGWNSESTHFFAASMSAKTGVAPIAISSAAADAERRIDMTLFLL